MKGLGNNINGTQTNTTPKINYWTVFCVLLSIIGPFVSEISPSFRAISIKVVMIAGTL